MNENRIGAKTGKRAINSGKTAKKENRTEEEIEAARIEVKETEIRKGEERENNHQDKETGPTPETEANKEDKTRDKALTEI